MPERRARTFPRGVLVDWAYKLFSRGQNLAGSPSGRGGSGDLNDNARRRGRRVGAARLNAVRTCGHYVDSPPADRP